MNHAIPYISKPNEIPNEAYHHSDDYKKFASSSNLKNYAISPKYARYTQLHPEEKKTSPAMKFGSVYHDYLASIVNHGDLSEFYLQWRAFEPPMNPKTNLSYGVGTKAYETALWEQEAEGIELFDTEQLHQIENMVNVLMTGSNHLSKDVQFLIKTGLAEQSHFIEYQGAGFKYRTDLKTAKKMVDWKTCELGVPRADEFPRQVVKFGYDISAAMYQFFEHELTGVWKPFFWIAQEKEPPYDFNILDSSEFTWDIFKQDGEQRVVANVGAMKFIRMMEQHIHCTENNDWPGYSIFTQPDWRNKRIAIPEVPGYHKNSVFTYYNDKK